MTIDLEEMSEDEALESALGPAEPADDADLSDEELDRELSDAAFAAVKAGDKVAFRDALLGLLGR
jgi:hypothetical protein